MIGFARNLYATPSGHSVVDTRDCMVRSLSVAGNMDISAAHQLYREVGRINGHGASITMLRDIFKKLDLTPKEQYFNKRERMTLQQLFIFGYMRKGRYIVITQGHALAVVDGVVHDWKLHKKYRVVYIFQLS